MAFKQAGWNLTMTPGEIVSVTAGLMMKPPQPII